MEVLSPAGNLDKLKYAYLYGADAAYAGLKSFSLRSKAENLSPKDAAAVAAVKKGRRLYGALNIYFHNRDISQLETKLSELGDFPLDGLIISDIGVIPLIKEHLPQLELHLSTQANCVNSEAAKLYRDLGFSRIILGRECSLREIEEIKKRVPDLGIEVFVHGAMCIAYSGRCLLSAYMAGRSANQGNCSHSCRWQYALLEEQERKGEYFPIFQNEHYTAILSSKDLCMIDHLVYLRNAGVDAIKIEGRMKSLYYTAVTTRAYRMGVDFIQGTINAEEFKKYRDELWKVSHREFSTGFYFSRKDADEHARGEYQREYVFLGTIGEKIAPGTYRLVVKNQIKPSDPLECIGPQVPFLRITDFAITDSSANPVTQADHGKEYLLHTGASIKEGYILRKKIGPY